MAVQRSNAAKIKKHASKKALPPAPKAKKKPQNSAKPKAKPAKPAPAKVKAPVMPAKKNLSAKAALAAKGKAGAANSPAKGPVKPVKVLSGLSRAELNHFRDLLLAKRREILGDVGTMENEAFKAGSNLSNMPIHMADVGSDNFEQEFTLGLIESERQMLREIQEALVRIDDGSYGICLGTAQPIGKVRLEAVPWAKYSMAYAQALESGLVRRESGHKAEEESGGGDDEED